MVDRAAGLRLAGRLAVLLLEDARAAEVRVVVVFDVLRGRVPDRVCLLEVDVLVLRDPGGEDVRVAMVLTLGERLTSHMD